MRDLRDFPDAHLRIFDRPAPPPPDSVESIHLVGICGTGMGSLAGMLSESGFVVRGSDKGAYPPMSDFLRRLDVAVLEGYDRANLDPRPDVVVVGNACTPTHVEAARAREEGLVQLSFPEALAHFFLAERRPVVIAGTHGKTTTTAMTVEIFRAAGRDPSFLVGGILSGWDKSYGIGSGEHFIVEGDEYDSAYFDKRPKFVHYRPMIATVTSMEFDHADIYASWDEYTEAFHVFAGLVDSNGLLALNGDARDVRELSRSASADIRTYGIHGDVDVRAAAITHDMEWTSFTLASDGHNIGELRLRLPGEHNVMNALAATTIALHEGISYDDIRAGLASFQGVKRRQEVRGEFGGVTVIDDFAHHPSAVRETVRAIRLRFPDRRLIAVFEPRSNSSRRKVFEAAYARSFLEADFALLSDPPFRHNDVRADFMDVGNLIEGLNREGVVASSFSSVDELLSDLVTLVETGDVVLIMSNGGFGGLHERLIGHLGANE